MELKRLLRCPAHQESLGFGLVHLRESIRANRPLDMGTDVSMPGHQEPGHTSNLQKWSGKSYMKILRS